MESDDHTRMRWGWYPGTCTRWPCCRQTLPGWCDLFHSKSYNIIFLTKFNKAEKPRLQSGGLKHLIKKNPILASTSGIFFPLNLHLHISQALGISYHTKRASGWTSSSQSHVLALPRASSEHQVDEQEIGLPCPISVRHYGRAFVTPGSSTSYPSSVQSTEGSELSTRKSWTDFVLGCPSESAGVDVLPRTTMDVPTIEFQL